MPIRRALLSVSDKAGLVEFAATLVEHGIKLLSTGGTFRALQDAGIAVDTVESYTGSPEVMDGRVKTLHPRVHGALLARIGRDEADLERLGAEPIDLVAVNLYPFEKTLAKEGSSFQDLIENIDIGGPSMLRSAAKNHERVTVVCEPGDYATVIGELESHGDVRPETRRQLAAKVFSLTSSYDAAIARWLASIGQAEQK